MPRGDGFHIKGVFIQESQLPFSGLIISRNNLVSFIYRTILQPEFNVRTIGLIELSKAVLKSSINIRLVVLDFDLQDKQGTNIRIVRRVANTKGMHMLVLTSHPLQRRMIKDIISMSRAEDRIEIADGFSKYIQGPYFILKAKQRLLAADLSSRRRKRSIESDHQGK